MIRNNFSTFLQLVQKATTFTQSTLPSAADPAQTERQFEAPEQPRSEGLDMAPPPRLWGEAPDGAEAATFVLKGLEVDRATAFAAEDFKRAAAITARRTGWPALSVSGRYSDFFKSTLEATRTRRLNDIVSLLIGPTGQRTGSALLSAEQFGLGGSQYGRGSAPRSIPARAPAAAAWPRQCQACAPT